MDRVKVRRVQSYLFKWERMLLDHLRRLRNTSHGDFQVIVQFTKERIVIHEIGDARPIVKELEELEELDN